LLWHERCFHPLPNAELDEPMEASKFITAFLFLNALTFGVNHSLAAEAQKKPEVHNRDIQPDAHKHTSRIEKTNAQWSADPERGWVRADADHEVQKQKEGEAKQTEGKQKANEGGMSQHY
jgi:hypothetical protein